jgi:hypothetical protein
METLMNINEQNMAAAMLTQSLLGIISPNFRMVAVSFSEDRWVICSWLEKEDREDREEIDDAIGDFSGLILDMENPASKVESIIEICSDALPMLDPSEWRVVFLRRE